MTLHLLPGEGDRNTQKNHNSHPGHGRVRDYFLWSAICSNRPTIRRLSPEENALLHLLLLRAILHLFLHCRIHNKSFGCTIEAKFGVAERGGETTCRRLRDIEGAEGGTFRDCYLYDLHILFRAQCYHPCGQSCLPKV